MTLIKDIFEGKERYIDQTITVSGWVRNIRFTKNIGFIELNDGSQFKPLQIVIDSILPNFIQISKLHLSSAIIVTGKLVETPTAKQPFEILADHIVIEGESLETYPLQKKRHSMEFLRTIGHLRPRTNTFYAAFRVRSVLSYAIHKFFQDRGFVYVHSPIITSSDAEGAGEMFRVTTLDLENLPYDQTGRVDYQEDFFNKETHLTVSGQLEAEAFAMAFRNVYTFGPTFRAENSNTSRHAAEFWMIEPEIAFADIHDLMDLAEDMVKYTITYVLKHAMQEMNFFNQFVDKTLLDRLQTVAAADFVRLTYTEAIEQLSQAEVDFQYPVAWGIDLQTEHERYLSEVLVKGPVFITDYPKEIKAFYMRLNDDQKTVAAVDLLVPGIGELIGGSQREERLDILLSKLEENHLKPDDYWWYLDLRKYGGTKHAGYGLGFERAMMYFTGIANIRDVLPFPRTVGNCEF